MIRNSARQKTAGSVAMFAALCLLGAAGAAAQGELDWVEVEMTVDGAGRAEVT